MCCLSLLEISYLFKCQQLLPSRHSVPVDAWVVDPFCTLLDSETVQILICSKDWIAASKGGEIKSVLKNMDMESMEQCFAIIVHMLEYQENDDSVVDLEDFLDDEVDE